MAAKGQQPSWRPRNTTSGLPRSTDIARPGGSAASPRRGHWHRALTSAGSVSEHGRHLQVFDINLSAQTGAMARGNDPYSAFRSCYLNRRGS